MGRMTRRYGLWAVGAILLAGLLFYLFMPRDPEVRTLTIERGEAVRTLAVNGRIRPRQSVEVKSPVAGTLLELPYDVGDRLTVDTTIARIDDGPQRAAIGQAEAAVRAQAAVVEQARRDQARFEALGEFATRQRVEQARLAVVQGSRELQRLQASRSEAREARDRFIIRAPFGGVVLERPVDLGQTVSTETVLYRIADLQAPEVTAEVDEIYAATLRPGTSALVQLAGRSERLAAKVVHIEPRVDEASGGRDVRLRFDAPLDSAPAGETVAVNLLVERRAGAISVPRSAILAPDSNPRVRIVDAEGRVREQAIRFDDWPADKVIVTQGLAPGERLMLDPDAAAPGTRVKIAR
jgi:RND family efflux transporter MFP subunit